MGTIHGSTHRLHTSARVNASSATSASLNGSPHPGCVRGTAFVRALQRSVLDRGCVAKHTVEPTPSGSHASSCRTPVAHDVPALAAAERGTVVGAVPGDTRGADFQENERIHKSISCGEVTAPLGA